MLVQNGAKGTRISAVGPDAIREGLWPDMKLADARAMIPDLRVVQHDVAADRALYGRLAHWMLRYSPFVSIQDAASFILDSTGCDHLFGGEAAMAEDIAARFVAMGFTTRIAIADTLGACAALVDHGAEPIRILPSEHGPDLVDRLPVEALRLQDDVVTLLKRLGLKRIGDVRPLPRQALERRFRESRKPAAKGQAVRLAQSVQWRLDHLSGAMAEPLAWIAEPQPFRVTRQCPELALESGAIAIALDEMLPRLCATLEDSLKGGRRFVLTGYRADGGSSSVDVMLSRPVNAPDAIRRLFRDRLERISCGFGIDLFVLEALRVEPVSAGQPDIIDPDQALISAASLATFAETMVNRTRSQTIARFAPVESHVPERAQKLAGIHAAPDWQAWKAVQPIWSPRPLRLLAHPEPAEVTAELPDSPPMQFVWRRVLRRVARARGPERILPEWWHDSLKAKPSALYRDYYDIEDEKGLRYWLFRAIREDPIADSDETVTTAHWFVHGLF